MSLRLTALSALLWFSTGFPTGVKGEHDEALLGEEIRAVVRAERQRLGIPGLSVALAREGRLLFAEGFGLADLEHGVAATATTAYRTASIAKPMTATAVLQLVEAGKVQLDATVQTYCSAFPEKRWPVTVRQLLGHLGGIRHYRSGQEASGTSHFYSVQEALSLFKEDPLLHEPGTRYNYTTYGYNLLGCVVEGASGMSYPEYMERHVWGPAGMVRTGVDDHFRIIPGRSRGYMKLEASTYESLPPFLRRQVQVGQVLNAPLHDTSMKIPGGGLVSTAVDLVRFVLALQGGRLLKKETLELMTTSQQTSDGNPTGYGLGWSLRESPEGRIIQHGGAQAGVRTVLVWYPSRGAAVAIMANLQGISLNPLVEKLEQLLLH